MSLNDRARDFMHASIAERYSYHFTWLGRPIIQYPQDIVAMQQLIWSIQPELILETGVAHGGSLIFSASMLELNAACGGPANARVLGLEVELRALNRKALEEHPLARRIEILEGDSVDPAVIAAVCSRAAGRSPVLVCLDSSHTHAHVLDELRAYGPLVTPGSYCVVFDTIVEELPEDAFPDRPWGPGCSPATAIEAFLKEFPHFEPDREIEQRLLITANPGGYLRRTT